MAYIVNGDEWVNVRAAPSTDAEIVGAIQTGKTIEPVEIVNGWAKIALNSGDTVIQVPETLVPEYGYMLARLLTAPTTTSPTSKKAILGVNCVDSAEAADQAIAAGVQAVSMTFNAPYCKTLRQYHPGIVVAGRGCWYKGSVPSFTFFDEKMGDALYTDGCHVIGLNEDDNGIGSSASDIYKRLDFDTKMLQHVKDVGGRNGVFLIYCGGGFSAGQPDITSQDVIKALAGYSDLLKDRNFAFNTHTYATDDHAKDITPTKIRDLIFDETNGVGQTVRYVNGRFETFDERIYRTDWTITRWRMFYRRCGWPSLDEDGNLTRIVSDETGIDVGSIGGFNAVPGCDDAYLQKFARKWVEIQSAPFDIGNGIMEPSHMAWGAIFQCGANPSWGGYNIQTKLSSFQACGWGQA
jgi:hypothetical protein